MSYEIIFHPSAFRELDKLPKAARERLAKAVDNLVEESRPQGAVKLTSADAYRIRVGTYRVVYAIRDKRLVILIVKVGHRREIYGEIEMIKQRLKEDL